MSAYPVLHGLELDKPADKVLRITMNRGKVNAMDYDMHYDISQIWRVIDRDKDVNAVIVTGQGDYFSPGGDYATDSRLGDEHSLALEMMKDARELVENMAACSKPIISAINGPAAGGGLVVALMADISIMADTAKIVDGHTTIGLAAGDHAAVMWPLLTSMAKAKYYLMTCEPVFGPEAERIGLVTECLPKDQVMPRCLAIATKLAGMSPTAVRWTKQSLNGWIKQAWPIFESSLSLEFLGLFGPDFTEGITSKMEKRSPKFKSQ